MDPISALLIAFLGGEPVDNYQDDTPRYRMSGECAAEGQYKPIVVDSGAGKTYFLTSDTKWCNPIGVTIYPQDDPTFSGNGG